MKDDRLYLIHITECITRIERYVADGRERFLADEKTQDAVLRNLQVLSESTQRLSQEFKEQNPDIDWKGLSGLRNILVHAYLGINLARIWEIVSDFLPRLMVRAQAMLSEVNRQTCT